METDSANTKKSGIFPFTALGIFLACASAVAAVMAGFGSRWDLWHFRIGFRILSFAAVGGGVSSLVSLFGLIAGIRRKAWRNSVLSCAGLALGLAIFVVPYSRYLDARQLPRIHDISTDLENPPEFIAISPLRKNAPNPSEYGGPDVAARQREAYPDIKPLILGFPPSKAFDIARSTARRMGWQIVGANKQELRIEATDTTFWFGFKDDIVVRITPLDGGSRIDARSVSRVGLSDVGTNADRLRRYLDAMAKNSRNEII